MSDTLSPPAPPRKRRSKYTRLNQDKAIELAKTGLGSTTIAAVLNVAPSTVWRFLQTIDLEQQQLKQYVSRRTEVFQVLQAKGLDLQTRLIDSFDDGILGAMKPSEKSNLLHAVNTVVGTIYDKERLESGKSTQNVGIVARMMGDAFDSAYLDKPDSSAPK